MGRLRSANRESPGFIRGECQLCRFLDSEAGRRSLRVHLQREQGFRRTLFSDMIIGFCVDLQRDCFAEGEETFYPLLREYFTQEAAEGCLYLIDLDHFKEVNDNLGHPAGDRILMDVAQELLDEFRSDDKVGRIGGDEFAVFSPGLRNFETILLRAESLNRRCRRTLPLPEGGSLPCSISIGVAVAPLHGTTVEELYHRADCALYFAKEDGRDRCAVFRPEMTQGAEVRRR